MNHRIDNLASLGRSVRTVVALTLALALASPAVPTLAARRGSDTIVGKRLSSGSIRTSAAPDIDAAAGILVTSDGRAVWSRQANSRRPMASTTKMMTALLVLERGKLNQKVRVSKRASRTPYGTGLRAGERLTARKLLEATLVASSNDSAYALGEHVGPGMPRFVRKMNSRAREMGLRNTRFANPHGLDASGHYSTPADLAKIAQAAMKHKEFRSIVKKRKVVLPASGGRGKMVLKTTDGLLGKYRGLTGVKTGYTNGAKFSFVAAAKRGRTSLTAVILGASSNQSRFTQSARLLDWGFKYSQTRTVGRTKGNVASVPVAGNPDRRIPVRLARPAKVRVFALDGKISRKLSLPDRLDLPVSKGQRLGEARFVQRGRVLARVPLVATASLASVETTVGNVPVTGLGRTVPARTVETTEVPKFDRRKPVERRVEIKPELTAPVAKGDRLGKVVYAQGDETITTVPVVAAAAVEQPGFLYRLGLSLARGWGELFSGEPAAN